MPRLNFEPNEYPNGEFTPKIFRQGSKPPFEDLNGEKNVTLQGQRNILDLLGNRKTLELLNASQQVIIKLLATSDIFLENVTADTTKVHVDNVNVKADRT